MDGHGAAAADDSSPIYGRSGFLAASSHGRGFTTSDSWDEASGAGKRRLKKEAMVTFWTARMILLVMLIIS
ncbi:hypothetical protein BDA96_02G203200 [Sorghum bicolor]|uniref:Uncharacterized protein n=2 Tax=Sorghum bicolor TaxID=4558 RepID=A0A921RPK7_SORBI|nr:hypothetical protein BDA96_02G203200 [Sorghum bicolor]KXG35565.1 hypothetical protein SORBI_3002G192800 [Sorghum bicolor]